MISTTYQPTPIQKLNMTLNGNTMFMKRDDLLPFSFGGNKVRKALLFFEEIATELYDYVVTYGSSSSNHCRVIANFAALKGIKCIIISPSENNEITFNSKMMTLFKADIITCKLSEVKTTIERTLEKLTNQNHKPFFIQGGGHGNLGTEAYVKAYQEIRDYELTNKTFFDYIFLTSGTGTTQAGLVCGQQIYNEKRKIIGISNARKNPYGEDTVLESVNSYLESIGKEKISLENVHFLDDYIIEGYGSYNNEIIKLIKEVLIKEGVPLDTTYTGKGFWGMNEFIKKNQIANKNILFIHTGGTPLFFDDLEELENV